MATDPEEAAQDRFRVMYEETLPVVYGFLMLRLGGKRALAEDLTAETYTAAVKLYKAGRADEVTLSWLCTVARRRLIDRWRRNTVAADNIIKLVQPAAAPTDDDVRATVQDALAALTESQRQALVLQHIEGYSVAEVAELLGRTSKATESLLARARAAFRRAFEEAEHD